METNSEKKWTEKDGIIYFSVTSNGATGGQWTNDLKIKGVRVTNDAKEILHSENFKPTNGYVYNIAVIKGGIFSDNYRFIERIRQEALRHKFFNSDAEVACLIREKFLNEDLEAMGLLWIIVMHEPIKISSDYNFPSSCRGNLLCSSHGDLGPLLETATDKSFIKWNSLHGFAFLVSKTL
ncbi:MAG: hypothetical protein WCK59_01195 [Candidatus Falkowbacteria bacterium]